MSQHDIIYWLDGPHDLRSNLSYGPINVIVWWEVFACKKCHKCYRIPSTMDMRQPFRWDDPNALKLIDMIFSDRNTDKMAGQMAEYFTRECEPK